jgi:hypothetical protein
VKVVLCLFQLQLDRVSCNTIDRYSRASLDPSSIAISFIEVKLFLNT